MSYEETDIINIIIAGTAGQGVITLKRLIEFAAQKSGSDLVLGTEMHGLAQREGAIVSHTRYQMKSYQNPRKNLQSPLICYGDADLFICLEPVEALRRGIFSSKKTTFVLNERTIPGVMITADLEEYPSLNEIEEILKKSSEEIYFINATQLSLDKFDTNQNMNIIMLGVAIATGKLPFIKTEHYEQVIHEWLRDPDNNVQALQLGIENGKQLMRKEHV
ncbi:MAG: hypothetical protein GF317_08450 [Candidatus Lokiarchaeota archaeon]|nr:hypothetical protein [Candidatus Lokiarchaeota archaeon]MBD3199744.1 hypothetical protein [Candidatus Lokiarchaeota archaeon]